MKQITRARDWVKGLRLPVRIPVPNRVNLIAMGLTALALGLITGVVIGPGLGPASNAIAGAMIPQTASVPETPASEEAVSDPGVELGTPAGSENLAGSPSGEDSAPIASVDIPDDSTTDYPDPVPEQEPVNEIDSDPDEPVENEPQAEEGTELKGTVVGVDARGRRFSLADSSGNMLALFGPAPPALGEAVLTRILPLANGTFAEAGEREATGIKAQTKLRGTVSWVDPVSRLAVISSRGSSTAVDLTAVPVDQEPMIEVGSPVEGVVLIAEPVEATETEPAIPGLAAQKMVVTGEPLERIELSGTFSSIDETRRVLVMSADSNGLVPAEIELKLPKKSLPPVTEGRAYDVTAERTGDGRLALTGLSPGYSRKSADDAKLAFGDHG